MEQNNENKDKQAKKTFSGLMYDFLTKYRKIILGAVICLIVLAAAGTVFIAVKENLTKKGFDKLEDISYAYQEAKKSLTAEELAVKEKEALETAKKLSETYKSGAVGSRIRMFSAEIYFAAKNWKDAQVQWVAAAEAHKKAYTAPLCYYNAAVCSEELGNADEAAAGFDKAATYDNFGLKPRAMFNAARIMDSQSKYEDAAKRYKALTDGYPNDSWASLAKTRLIALQAEGKIQ